MHKPLTMRLLVALFIGGTALPAQATRLMFQPTGLSLDFTLITAVIEFSGPDLPTLSYSALFPDESPNPPPTLADLNAAGLTSLDIQYSKPLFSPGTGLFFGHFGLGDLLGAGVFLGYTIAPGPFISINIQEGAPRLNERLEITPTSITVVDEHGCGFLPLDEGCRASGFWVDVPEPATCTLLGSALLGFGFLRRRRSN